MPCVHLQKLFQLCHDQEIKLASSDLIHIVCTQCGEQEVCPSMLTDEYDSRHPHGEGPSVEAAPQSK